MFLNNKKFSIIRHGETKNNADGLNRGWLDVPLNERGIQQAHEIADKIKDKKVEALIASPFTRARQTADIISKKNNIPVLGTHEGLRPWHIGIHTGQGISKTLPELHKYMDNPNHRIPGGESFNEFKDRTMKALKEMQAMFPDKHLGFVTHHRVERLVAAHTSPEGGIGNFHLPIQKTKGIDPAEHMTHNWKDLFPKQ